MYMDLEKLLVLVRRLLAQSLDKGQSQRRDLEATLTSHSPLSVQKTKFRYNTIKYKTV